LLAGKEGGTFKIHVIPVGIAKGPELELCVLDEVQTKGFAAVGPLTILIDYERAQLQFRAYRYAHRYNMNFEGTTLFSSQQ
jgi:hypothetical protein